jgi:hypothetical protein
MRTRSFVAFSFAVFVTATAVATLTEPRYPIIGKFIWPGSGVTFLILLLLHANYFGHPLLITCLDVFFNALLYTGIAVALRRLLHMGTMKGRS